MAISHEGGEGHHGSLDMFANGPDGAATVACYNGNLSIGSGDIRRYDYAAPHVAVTDGLCLLGAGRQLTPDTCAAQNRTVAAVTVIGGACSMRAKVSANGGTGKTISFASDGPDNYYDPNSNPQRPFDLPNTQAQGSHGTMTQIGSATIQTDGTVTFARPFLHNFLSVNATLTGVDSPQGTLAVEQFSLTGFVAHVRRSGTAAGHTVGITSTAIGN